jgi:restriction system protein
VTRIVGMHAVFSPIRMTKECGQSLSSVLQVENHMTVPDFQSIMLPLLQAVADGKEYRATELIAHMVQHFRLSEEDQSEMLASGNGTVLYSRVQWAKTFLKQAGLLHSPSRGTVRITDAGQGVLREPPSRIDVGFLSRYPSFQAFRARSSSNRKVIQPVDDEESSTPEEIMASTWKLLRQQTADELLEKIGQCTPAFFERLVVDLLVAMGYGGSRRDAGQSVGRSGDGGVDGIIKEDKLGLDAVYIQAKRWGRSVGRPEVQGFAGSLEGYRARKGVMITTSTFTGEAQEYVTHIEKRIVLIDGPMLANLMLDHNVGVTIATSYTLQRLDLDYFEEE